MERSFACLGRRYDLAIYAIVSALEVTYCHLVDVRTYFGGTPDFTPSFFSASCTTLRVIALAQSMLATMESFCLFCSVEYCSQVK